jgi:class 3 adenylate cyclase
MSKHEDDGLSDELREILHNARCRKLPYGCSEPPRGTSVAGMVRDASGSVRELIEKRGQAVWHIINRARKLVPYDYECTAHDNRFRWTDAAPQTEAERVILAGTARPAINRTAYQIKYTRRFKIESDGATSVVTRCRYHEHICNFAFTSTGGSSGEIANESVPSGPPKSGPMDSSSFQSGDVTMASTPTNSQVAGRETVMTVVEVDLVGYGKIAPLIEENLSAGALLDFNRGIQELITGALAKIGIDRKKAVKSTAGDNAILTFDNPVDAHNFVKFLNEGCEKHNRQKVAPSARRIFRAGAATGVIAQLHAEGIEEFGGLAIMHAVRLEAAAKPGELLIHAKSHELLPPDIQCLYGPKILVRGKSAELDIPAHRISFYTGPGGDGPTPSPGGDSPAPTIDEILLLFDKLNPPDQMKMIYTMIGIPEDHRPPATLSLQERKAATLDWAAAAPGGLKLLRDCLLQLIQRQSKK